MKKIFLLLEKGRFFFIMALLLLLSLLISVGPSFSQPPIKLRIATQPLGGTMYLIGAGVAEALKKGLPTGSMVDVLPYAGGIGNAKVVSKGDAEIGLAQNVTNVWAYLGKPPYDTKMENLRGLLGGYDAGWLLFMVHPKVHLNSIEEIKEKKFPLRLMILPPGSMGEAGAKHLMDGYGISEGDLKAWGGSVIRTSFEVIQNAFQDGRADCWIHTIPPNHPIVTELSLTTGIKFLPLNEKAVKHMANEGWAPYLMPAGTWKGQDRDVMSVGWWCCLITTKDFPDDLAYLVTKTVLENKDIVTKVYNGFKILDPKTAWTNEKNGLPLHPGAIRYYKEKKLMP